MSNRYCCFLRPMYCISVFNQRQYLIKSVVEVSALSSSIVLLITTTEAEARGMALTMEVREGD